MRILSLLFLCVVLIGCASTESKREAVITPLPATELLGASSADERDSIMESVFRHMCQEPLEKDYKVYFLGVGYSHDPTPEFLKRLSELNAPVKPISVGKWGRFYIYDRLTRERGIAIYIRRITMISGDEAEVEARIDSGGRLSASGPIYSVTRKNGRWVVTGTRIGWIS